MSEVLAFGNVYMIFVSGHGKNQQNVLVKKWENIKNEKWLTIKSTDVIIDTINNILKK